jgi:hypothetical protein
LSRYRFIAFGKEPAEEPEARAQRQGEAGPQALGYVRDGAGFDQLQADAPVLDRARVLARPREARRHSSLGVVPVHAVDGTARPRVERDRGPGEAARDLLQCGLHLRLLQVDEHRLGDQEAGRGAPADGGDPLRIDDGRGDLGATVGFGKEGGHEYRESDVEAMYLWLRRFESRADSR